MSHPLDKFGKDVRVGPWVRKDGPVVIQVDYPEIRTKMTELGWTASGPAQDGGDVQPCNEGLICSRGSVGAHAVQGGILVKYLALGGPSGFLGFPSSDELATPDGRGRFNQFQHGSIYWAPETGAYEVHGIILAKYLNAGGPTGWLGYPRTDETDSSNQFEHGAIYRYGTGAYEVHGAILARYLTLGGATSWLGRPITDEAATPDGRGQFNRFEQGGIYCTPLSGAFELQGDGPPPKFEATGPLRFEGDTPVGGSATIVIRLDGSYTFSGHLHDSGSLDYSESVACVVVAKGPSKAYVFAHNGKMYGTWTPGSRDDDWSESGVRPELVEDWLDICAGVEMHFELRVNFNAAGWVDTVKEIYPYVKTVVEMVG